MPPPPNPHTHTHAHTHTTGPDFKTLVTPLVKHVRLHMIDPQDIMKVSCGQ